MVSQAVQQLFIKAYTVIKLNLLFWALSFSGGLILGIGPSLMVINELFYDHGYNYSQFTWKKSWCLFKKNFDMGNKIFYSFAAIAFILSYSLFLSVQIPGLVFLIIDFIIVIVLLAIVCIYAYTLNIKAGFEINYLNSFKLACAHYFFNFFDNLKQIVGMAIILGITYKFLGLILFATVSLMIIYTQFVGKNWLKHVDELN